MDYRGLPPGFLDEWKQMNPTESRVQRIINLNDCLVDLLKEEYIFTIAKEHNIEFEFGHSPVSHNWGYRALAIREAHLPIGAGFTKAKGYFALHMCFKLERGSLEFLELNTTDMNVENDKPYWIGMDPEDYRIIVNHLNGRFVHNGGNDYYRLPSAALMNLHAPISAEYIRVELAKKMDEYIKLARQV